ncbi:hypothetical protein OPT61_g8526 [Boeremia exigua]|uniref:Uncharacterized protein n=1 Tax=Boeremia exigua TaxID=749465 RepID=A0ACC2HYR4_9PLEO|nr:hypothetical protein OPT61_g8526 [Boeremia exigua]
MAEGNSSGNATNHHLGATSASLPAIQAPAAVQAPTAFTTRRTRLHPHNDAGPLSIDAQQVNRFYPIAPGNLGVIYMLHPLRYLPPAGKFFWIQGVGTKYPELKTEEYCRHCFTLKQTSPVCSNPCSQPCGCCGSPHNVPSPFCPLAYNTLLSWRRKGCIASEHDAPATGSIMPSRAQFEVLKANGYIDPGQAYSPTDVPRFTDKAPLDRRQSQAHIFVFGGPPPPPRNNLQNLARAQHTPTQPQYVLAQPQVPSYGGYTGGFNGGFPGGYNPGFPGGYNAGFHGGYHSGYPSGGFQPNHLAPMPPPPSPSPSPALSSRSSRTSRDRATRKDGNVTHVYVNTSPAQQSTNTSQPSHARRGNDQRRHGYSGIQRSGGHQGIQRFNRGGRRGLDLFGAIRDQATDPATARQASNNRRILSGDISDATGQQGEPAPAQPERPAASTSNRIRFADTAGGEGTGRFEDLPDAGSSTAAADASNRIRFADTANGEDIGQSENLQDAGSSTGTNQDSGWASGLFRWYMNGS